MDLQKQHERLDTGGHLVFLYFYPLGNWPARYDPGNSPYKTFVDFGHLHQILLPYLVSSSFTPIC